MIKFSVMNIVVSITAVLGMVGGIFTLDARYTKTSELTVMKNEIIGEMRREVSMNRNVMIGSMLREADDLEYQMSEYELKNEPIPRYIIEKHNQIQREIDEIKNTE